MQVDALCAARGGVRDQRENMVFLAVDAAGGKQAEHVQRRALHCRVDRAD